MTRVIRRQPARDSTKSLPAKAAEDTEKTPSKGPVAEEHGSRSTRRTRGQTKSGDTKDGAQDVVVADQKKTRGRKRKGAPAEEEKSSEESTAPDLKKDEAEEPAKEEEGPKDIAKEEPKSESKDELKVESQAETKNSSATDALEPSKASQEGEIKVNRAPVLTMWVAAVAERQGFTFDEAVTFGKAISGIFAHSKGKSIGVIDDTSKDSVQADKKKTKKEKEKFEVFGNSVYGKTTEKGRFAVESGKTIVPNTVKGYLHRAFKDDYDRVKEAFEALANSLEPEEIGSKAYHLYEKFRPNVPDGARGWGARGLLDLKHVQELAASG